MQYKASTISTKFPEKMAAIAPVAIGTRGTVGSLVRKEIDYFSKVELERCGSSRKELERCGSSRKPQEQVVDMAQSGGQSRTSFWSPTLSWKRKKRKGSNGFLPTICSGVEVADSNKLNEIPGFRYRILKSDVHKIHV